MPRDEDIDLSVLLHPEPEALREGGIPPLPVWKSERLRRLPNLFARVPLSWLDGTDPRESPFGPGERLFRLLLIRSHWGQREVRLTNAMVDEIGVPRTTKISCLARWEEQGWVRINRNGQHTLRVRPVVLAG